MQTILCPIDLTDGSQRTLDVAADLAARLKSSIELLHVIHSPPGLPAEYLVDVALLDVRDGARASLARKADELAARRVQARVHVSLDRVGEGILRRARETGAGLIVVGSHTRHAAARLFLGSTAERLVRTAPCPVVVVPPLAGTPPAIPAGPPRPLRLVAGIDLSPASDAVLSWLRTVSATTPCDLRLLHLYSPPREHERLGLSPPDPFEADPDVLAVLARELKARVVGALGDEPTTIRVRPWWGGEQNPLAWEAETDEADFLVVGASPRRHARALSAIRGATLPVICVPTAPAQDGVPAVLAPVRSVLVTTDFSPQGNAAVNEAYRLLLGTGGDVTLLHVTEKDKVGLDDQRAAELEACLLALVPEGSTSHAVRSRAVVVADADPAGAIIKSIHRLGPDLVVMSSHGSDLRHAIHGSVTEKVLSAAVKPVLVVPAARGSAPRET